MCTSPLLEKSLDVLLPVIKFPQTYEGVLPRPFLLCSVIRFFDSASVALNFLANIDIFHL